MIRKPLMTLVGNISRTSLSVLCMSGYLLLAACGGGGGGTSSAVAVLPANSLPTGTETVEATPVVGASVTTCGVITSSGTYVLQNDVSSDGTCFSITAPNVVLDLNGHTVTYDNLAPIAVTNHSFEDSLTGTWDVTNAANATRAAGMFVGTTVSKYDGDYALRFALPFTGPQYVRSQQVTLAANTTYSVSAMFRNSGNSDTGSPYVAAQRDPITMKIELEGTSNSATKTGATWAGFQYVYFTYTTGASPENHVIRITVDNVPTTAQNYLYVDDVMVRRTSVYGVYTGSADYTTITNGTITQGQGSSFASHAIMFGESANTGTNVNNLTLTTTGVNSRVFYAYYLGGGTFNNNTINHNIHAIESRSQYDGAALTIAYLGGAGTIYNNTFNTGVQTAIRAGAATTGQHKIYGNNITLQSKYTNDFAIFAKGSEIYSNIVNCGSGSNSCRGIWIGDANTKVYNNTVSVQQLERNQEYNGCESGGAYGMQAEAGTLNAETYGNTVTAYAGVCEAHALRLNPLYTDTPTINIHDNTFTVVASGSARASAIKADNVHTSGVVVTNNIFQTNRRWLYLENATGGSLSMTLTGNKFETVGTVDSPFYPFELDNDVATVNANFTFVDNLYGTGDQTRFESEYFRTPVGTVDAGSSITVVP